MMLHKQRPKIQRPVPWRAPLSESESAAATRLWTDFQSGVYDYLVTSARQHFTLQACLRSGALRRDINPRDLRTDYL